MYKAKFDQEWPRYFSELDEAVKERVAKKIDKILDKILVYPNKRHLSKSSFFVDDVGQYRIIYMVFEQNCDILFCWHT